jgi:uncharacterized protein (TIGR02246 family)
MQTLPKYNQVMDVIAAMSSAWERGDADAYGALFTEDASYTVFVGTVYHGRRDITESHRVLFAKFLKGTRLAVGKSHVRFYGTDTAVVTSSGDTYKRRPPRKLSKVQTFTLVRQPDGAWLIAAFHNTQRKTWMEAISFRFAPQLRPTPPAHESS